jgi:hypothetical protein
MLGRMYWRYKKEYDQAHVHFLKAILRLVWPLGHAVAAIRRMRGKHQNPRVTVMPLFMK